MQNIYLFRHFKVKDSSSSWLNSDEFDKWVKDYDSFELEYSDIVLSKNIDKIYVSSQVEAFISHINLNKDILIISYGFFMIKLIKKLKSLGFHLD